MRYRIEKDSLGEKIIPAEAYYGIKTLRSKEAFQITKHGQCRQNIKAFAYVIKAYARTNSECGLLDKKKAEAISLSCDEILNGRLHGQFITDSIQDGYGVGMNDNAVEVICNRANEMMSGEKGKYDKVTLAEVQMNQSCNEVVILAGKMTTIRLTKKLIAEGKKYINAFTDKLVEYSLNKDENNSLGQELSSFNSIFERDIKRLDKTLSSMLEIGFQGNIQLTNEDRINYYKKLLKNINQVSGEDFSYSKNKYDASRCLDCFMLVSVAVKNLTVNLSKCAQDMKKLLVDKRISVPKIQETNTVDENYIVLDMVKQISYYTTGNDLTISRAVEEGNLESNVFLPMINACLFESCNLVRRTIRTYREKVIEVLKVEK